MREKGSVCLCVCNVHVLEQESVQVQKLIENRFGCAILQLPMITDHADPLKSAYIRSIHCKPWKSDAILKQWIRKLFNWFELSRSLLYLSFYPLWNLGIITGFWSIGNLSANHANIRPIFVVCAVCIVMSRWYFVYYNIEHLPSSLRIVYLLYSSVDMSPIC